MKKPLLISVSALALLTLSATLFAQTTTGSSLISQMKAATHAFTLAGDLNPGTTGLESSPLVGKRTGDMLSAGEYNRLLELVGQGGGGGGTAVYDSGWFSAHSNGATYKTGEGGIPAYTLGKKADIIKLYFRANATSPEREVPSFQMSGAESAWSLAWGDIYGPRPVTLDSSYISIQYGTSVGGACYKFGPGFSSPCGFNGSNIYYEDVGQLKIVAYSFGGTGGGGGGGGNDGASATPKGMTVLNTPIGGSGTWTVPAGVTQIKVTLIGGGGGGSGGGYGAYAGGGGAGTITAYIGDLVPGTTIPYTLGRGGNGGAAPGQKDGTNTVFNGMTANGGGGGHATSGGASGGFSPVTTVTHGSVKGFVGFQGQGGSASGTGGHSGGGFGAGAHTTSSSVGYSGLAFGGGAGSSSTGGGGTGGPGGIIIEW